MHLLRKFPFPRGGKGAKSGYRARMSRALPDALRTPHPNRLPAAAPGREEILAAHEAALTRNDPGYFDPFTRLYVMTAQYLWDRGECCNTGCRHCPYLER